MWLSIVQIVWLLLLFQPAAATSDPNFCHDIRSGGHKDNFKANCNNNDTGLVLVPSKCWRDCRLDPAKNYYGADDKEEVNLDFSLATEAEIRDFFRKPGAENAVLKAGITLIGNDKVKTLDFGNVTEWQSAAHSSPFVNIHSNRKLKRIIWGETMKISAMQGQTASTVTIFNNPELKWAPDQIERLKSFVYNDGGLSIIYNDTKECRTTALGKKIVVEQKLLDKCHAIIGDVQLENVKLTRDLILKNDIITDKIKGACLQLINVDFNGHKLIFKDRIGTHDCHDGTESAITKNPNLCGDEITELLEQSVIGEQHLEMHKESCTINCTLAQAMNPYYLCDSIIEDVDISLWFFGDAKYAIDRQKQLKYARGIRIVSQDGELDAISLPNLKTVESLEISKIKKLKKIDLGELVAVEKLTFKGNVHSYLDVFPLGFAPKLEKFPDGYNLDTECIIEYGTLVTDLKQIRLCKRIIGELTLEKLPEDNPEIFHVEDVRCVTVRDTKLSSLHFLDKLKTSTCDKHWIKNNPNLCARGYLEQLLKDPAHMVTLENNKNDKDCPCIQSDIAIKGGSSDKCEKVRLYKPFSCKEYDSSRLIEAEGSLILVDCQDLEKSFANLKKITAVVKVPPLVVERDSDAPSVEFLKGIELVPSANQTTLMLIESLDDISHYLSIRHTFGDAAVLKFHPTKFQPTGQECFEDYLHDNCFKYIGDLVAKDDKFWKSTDIIEITGCLIVLNGTQLNFLAGLQTAGKKCLYGDGGLYPHSPSAGFEKSTVQMAKNDKFCPLREERDRLEAATGVHNLNFSGTGDFCLKACRSMLDGNCDSLYGNLNVTPVFYILNLEVVYGRMEIVGRVFEEIKFPKLQAIHADTSPALIIHDNECLSQLLMPNLENITSTNSSRPLIKITKNPNLNSVDDFLPDKFRRECNGNPNSMCFIDNSVPYEEDLTETYAILAAILVFLIVAPPLAYCLHMRRKERILERVMEKERAQAERKKRREEMLREMSHESASSTPKITVQQRESRQPMPVASVEQPGDPDSSPRASKRSSRSGEDLWGRGSKGAVTPASGSVEGKTPTGRST